MTAHELKPFTHVLHVGRTGSTNTDLREAATADPAAWPHMSVLVADAQDAGRGRAGRSWVTAPGTALTASVLLRPRVPAGRLAWVTLLAGLAVKRATAELTGLPTGVKWPNDVLVLRAGDEEIDGWGTDRKVAGILAEVLPEAHPEAEPGVIIGIGVNVAQAEDQLPVPWATSLHLAAGRAGAAARPTVSEVLLACGRHLAALVARWEEFDGDAHAAGLAEQVRGACVTLGRRVRAELPGERAVTGVAVELDPDGHLVVRTPDGARTTVRAGDVLHMRTAGA